MLKPINYFFEKFLFSSWCLGIWFGILIAITTYFIPLEVGVKALMIFWIIGSLASTIIGLCAEKGEKVWLSFKNNLQNKIDNPIQSPILKIGVKTFLTAMGFSGQLIRHSFYGFTVSLLLKLLIDHVEGYAVNYIFFSLWTFCTLISSFIGFCLARPQLKVSTTLNTLLIRKRQQFWLVLLLLPTLCFCVWKEHTSYLQAQAFETFRAKGDALLDLDYSIDALSDCYQDNGLKHPSKRRGDNDAAAVCNFWPTHLDNSLKKLRNIMPTTTEMNRQINIVLNRQNKAALNNEEAKAARHVYNLYLKMFTPEAKAYGYKDVREAMVY